MPLFSTPVAYTGPRLRPDTRGPARQFFRWAGPAPVGVTVLKEDGVWSSVQNPDANRVAAAERVFLGAHEYVIDDDLAAELIAAGYSENIT